MYPEIGHFSLILALAVALVQGDRSFPNFEAMVEITVAASPNRSPESLRRGVFHNSKELDDGTWTWRYDTFRKGEGFEGLWDDALLLQTPTTLVRGANSFFVNDDDAERFARDAPGFQRVIVVPDSGHSVQGDQPRALVEILRGVLRPSFAALYPLLDFAPDQPVSLQHTAVDSPEYIGASLL